jgi:Fe-S oxidoreductase
MASTTIHERRCVPRSRDKGLCCGGGGAQVWFETPQERPVAEIRLHEAMETGAPTVASACPFCTIMLGSAAQSQGVTDEVAVKDLAQIVAAALNASEPDVPEPGEPERP